MNCEEARELLYEIIDKEASEVDARRVQEHIDKCRECFDIYRFEGAIQEFITRKLRDNRPSLRLEVLKSRVMAELKTIDHPRVAKGRWPFSPFTKSLVAAAAAIIVVAVFLLGSDFVRESESFASLTELHRVATRTLDVFRDVGNTTGAIAFSREELTYAVAPHVSEFLLIGGCLEQFRGTQVGHFVYLDGLTTVSVFLVPADCIEMPPELVAGKVERDGITYFGHDCGGCRLMFHRLGSTLVVTATTEPSVDLVGFVPGQGAI